ncbi:chain-length determining protein [Pseudomonas tructae]|uniref:Chain-length determining protein n=1 Tax=Pseudomonas tructae TaxID=2518644 RepID=A0A411MMA9_9PSED|nr:GNVR domain-containing protein [Pseudomonas tructae]QBF27928.1 chain-length determining protein [Pseudomonas tructae]
MSSVSRIPPVAESDEIELFALVESVWKQKNFVLVIAALIAGAAALYAFLATPEYRVASVLRPVALKELDALNRSGIYSLAPEAALLKVGGALDSYEMRLEFFKANPDLFKAIEEPGNSFDQNFEAFNKKSLRVTVNNGSKLAGLPSSVALELDYPEKIDGVQILNSFVDFAVATERQKLASDFEVVLKNRITELDKKIDAARATYELDKEVKIARLQEVDDLRRAQLQDELNALRQQLKLLRKDRIAQLTEAIGIARALGIVKPTTPSALAEAEHAASARVMRTEVNNQQIPLYFMGTEALEAERAALLQRKSDEFTEARVAQIFKELQMLQVNREIQVLKRRSNEDIFLADVESLRNEYLRLSTLQIDVNQLQLVGIDRRAVQPTAPVKPQKMMVIVLGLMLGLILGTVCALVRQFLRIKNMARVTRASLDLGAPTLPAVAAKGLQRD